MYIYIYIYLNIYTYTVLKIAKCMRAGATIDVGGVADYSSGDHQEDSRCSILRSPTTSGPHPTNVWRVVSLSSGGSRSESSSLRDSLDSPLQEYVSAVRYLWGQDRPHEVHIPKDFFVECVAFPMPSLAHVTAVSSNPLNLRRFVVCGFAQIQVSGDSFFDEPDTMCIAFCSCCENGEQAWNMVRLMCHQPNIATRDREETDSVTCLHSRALRHLAPLWHSHGIPGLVTMAMSARAGDVSLVSNVFHVSHAFIRCHSCIQLSVIHSSLSVCHPSVSITALSFSLRAVKFYVVLLCMF